MSSRLLLCTDMDRTLLPNGEQTEVRGAREFFSAFVESENISLAYVTGRHLNLVLDAIAEFGVPVPDYAITDVGTKIYHHQHGQWRALKAWEQEIDAAWAGKTHEDLQRLFEDCTALVLQEDEKQNTHKLSYYVSLQADRPLLLNEMERRLDNLGVQASLVWSVDEPNDTGLLDVLPVNATKLHAIDFLRHYLGYEVSEVVFCGDSGNDLAVLSSHIPSVLVANGSDEVRETAMALAREYGNSETLYVAEGRYLGMNGNYAAGILEGVWHYMPGFRVELEKAMGVMHAR